MVVTGKGWRMTRPLPFDPVGEKLFRCWQGGIGIDETIKAVERTCHVTLGFEDVRRRFTDLSQRFAGGAR